MVEVNVTCHRPGHWGTRTGRHVIKPDGSREFCPTCDGQDPPPARAIGSWWRRLFARLRPAPTLYLMPPPPSLPSRGVPMSG